MGGTGRPKRPTVCNDWLQACSERVRERGGAEGSPAVVCPLLLHRLSHKSQGRGEGR